MFGVVGEVAGKLFGTDKAVDNLLDKDKGLLVRAGGWVGGLSYTKEEQAEGDLKTREWGLRQLEALAPFKIVQRILAFNVAGVWTFLIFNIVLAIWIRVLTRKLVTFNGQQVWQSVDAVTPLLEFAFSDFVFWPTVVVFALYFTGGILPHKGKS
jgi:hypothetical protein